MTDKEEINMEDLRCDTCGAPAPNGPPTSVHVLPWVHDVERVELTGDCDCDCDPGGYWFSLTDWRFELREGNGYWSMRDQLDSKRNGARAVALVDRRLGLDVEVTALIPIPKSPFDQPHTPEQMAAEFIEFLNS